MDAIELLQYMVDQEHKSLGNLFDKIPDDDLGKPLFANDTVTIGKRLAHLIETEYRMATYLYEDENDLESLEVDPTSIDAIRDAAKTSKDRHNLTLENLTTDDLNKMWTSSKSGNSYEYKYLLWHFIEHIATHRGQVMTAVRRLE